MGEGEKRENEADNENHRLLWIGMFSPYKSDAVFISVWLVKLYII